MSDLKTTIGLEIHVQLKTKSKMFCRCDNNAEGKAPNTVVCPICLGMPGTLPVANKQAILWTLKSGLALNCKINKVSKFDRKHYFYPDLPKGYQISQYDEPLCGEGYLEVDKAKIRLNRIHLEEDAGKLMHSGGESLVDLNRAGTPLMEIVTEPDITSPKQAGDFLRKLQKIVRDVVTVSEASMEKGHLRCDANISVTDGEKMSQIIELKNINSFRFVEKALMLADEKLKEEFSNWPEKLKKETWGYDSANNKIFIQRRKEEAADYRYFPEPDLPPIDASEFDLETLRAEFNESEEEKTAQLVNLGIADNDAKLLARDRQKSRMFAEISVNLAKGDAPVVAKTIIQNYFGFNFNESDYSKVLEYSKLIDFFVIKKISKSQFGDIALCLHKGEIETVEQATEKTEEIDLEDIISSVLESYPNEVTRFMNGEKQLLGFFMGQVMKTTGGKADPSVANKLLREKLGK
jgi:aspartyl-tRNA(Asn)/glutamyl-tRNA(Gln) amidotransferase subunit B